MRPPAFMWSGRPVYRCRVCGSRYERIGNLRAVLAHEEREHGARARVSPIVGPGGESLVILED